MSFIKKDFVSAFYSWIPLAVAIAFICGLIYVSVQQEMRMSVNDQLVQMSEDIAANISKQDTFDPGQPASTIDITKSIDPFIILFDGKMSPIYSTAEIDGKPPILPKGVFDYTKKNGQERLTWQPTANSRNAVVVTYYKTKKFDGYVVAGRSLREVEKRVDNLLALNLLGGAFTLILTFTASFAVQVLNKKKHN